VLIPVGGSYTNLPELLLLKLLPLSDHHSHFWTATFDFTTFFMLPFFAWAAPFFFYSLAVLCILWYLQESHCALCLQFPTKLYASFMLIITLLSIKVLLYRYIHFKLQQLVAKWRGGKMKLLNRKVCLPKKVQSKTNIETKNISRL